MSRNLKRHLPLSSKIILKCPKKITDWVKQRYWKNYHQNFKIRKIFSWTAKIFLDIIKLISSNSLQNTHTFAYCRKKNNFRTSLSENPTNNPENSKLHILTWFLDIPNKQVFFRAGVLGQMEEFRDERLSRIMSWMQAWARGYLNRKTFKKLQEQRLALTVVQRALRRYLKLRTWPWWKLWQKVKPLLNASRVEDQIAVSLKNFKKYLFRFFYLRNL